MFSKLYPCILYAVLRMLSASYAKDAYPEIEDSRNVPKFSKEHFMLPVFRQNLNVSGSELHPREGKYKTLPEHTQLQSAAHLKVKNKNEEEEISGRVLDVKSEDLNVVSRILGLGQGAFDADKSNETNVGGGNHNQDGGNVGTGMGGGYDVNNSEESNVDSGNSNQGGGNVGTGIGGGFQIGGNLANWKYWINLGKYGKLGNWNNAQNNGPLQHSASGNGNRRIICGNNYIFYLRDCVGDKGRNNGFLHYLLGGRNRNTKIICENKYRVDLGDCAWYNDKPARITTENFWDDDNTNGGN